MYRLTRYDTVNTIHHFFSFLLFKVRIVIYTKIEHAHNIKLVVHGNVEFPVVKTINARLTGDLSAAHPMQLEKEKIVLL